MAFVKAQTSEQIYPRTPRTYTVYYSLKHTIDADGWITDNGGQADYRGYDSATPDATLTLEAGRYKAVLDVEGTPSADVSYSIMSSSTTSVSWLSRSSAGSSNRMFTITEPTTVKIIVKTWGARVRPSLYKIGI